MGRRKITSPCPVLLMLIPFKLLFTNVIVYLAKNSLIPFSADVSMLRFVGMILPDVDFDLHDVVDSLLASVDRSVAGA